VLKEGGLTIVFEVPTSWLRGRVRKSEVKETAARLAADVASCYLSELQLFTQANSRLLGRSNRIFIEHQLQRSKEELAKAEGRLEKFQKAHPTLMPPDKASSYANQALELASQQVQVDIALHEAQGQIARARATWTAHAPTELSPEAVIDNPVISELKADLAKLEVRRATLLENFTESHPDVVALEQEIQKTYERIKEEVSKIVAGKAGSTSPAHQELVKQLVVLEINRDGLESRKAGLSSAMAEIERRLSSLPPLEMEYGRLLRDLKAADTVYMTLLTEYAKARANEEWDAETFVIVDRPVVPNGPAKPSPKLFLLASLLFGLFAGVFIAIVQEGFTRSSDELRKAKGAYRK
ncbi:MAG: GNVR domain-containing protein, partial [Armatimonadota bacterium]|nr:GNVR domain-containing protein [Armatimonadota bacterium]